MKPQKIDDVMMAFPASVKHLMPDMNTLPREFQEERDTFSPLVNKWFFSGLDKNALKIKEGIDERDAWRHLKAIMGSFEPKHEDKTAAVAYLMSQWFDKVKS